MTGYLTGNLIDPEGADELLTTAERSIPVAAKLGIQFDAELLVIGARRRSPLGKVLLDSAAHRIILDANVSVLVVKEKAEPI
jgi:nucleotide-binding universal stress UspA family protein